MQDACVLGAGHAVGAEDLPEEKKRGGASTVGVQSSQSQFPHLTANVSPKDGGKERLDPRPRGRVQDPEADQGPDAQGFRPEPPASQSRLHFRIPTAHRAKTNAPVREVSGKRELRDLRRVSP